MGVVLIHTLWGTYVPTSLPYTVSYLACFFITTYYLGLRYYCPGEFL